MQNNAGIVKKNQDLSLKQSSVFLLLPKNKTVKYAQIKVKKIRPKLQIAADRPEHKIKSNEG